MEKPFFDDGGRCTVENSEIHLRHSPWPTTAADLPKEVADGGRVRSKAKKMASTHSR